MRTLDFASDWLIANLGTVNIKSARQVNSENVKLTGVNF